MGGLASTVALPTLASARTGDPQALEIAFPAMRRVSDTLWIGKRTSSVWIYTVTHPLDGKLWYPANGAIVVDAGESILVDSGWRDADADAIVDEWQRMRMPPIARALITHFHADRTGGIRALKKRGIPAYGNPLTIGLAVDNGLPAPLPLHDLEKHPQRLGRVEAFYPGAGHTLDNIVAWVPGDGVLFGGCLVKSITAGDLGNVDDARISDWHTTMRTLARRYRPRHVIPGHGTIAGDALAHTEALVMAANRASADVSANRLR